jgi:hypothetical protein
MLIKRLVCIFGILCQVTLPFSLPLVLIAALFLHAAGYQGSDF